MRFCILAVALSTLAWSPVAAQGWSGPFQLTNDTFADVNPSACPEWVNGLNTYMVWQTNRSGNWDIYAKVCEFMQGNGWGAEESISTGSANDVNPAVAACNDTYGRSGSFWCVWERKQSPLVGSIWACFNPSSEGWQEPESVGYYVHTGGDSARPRIIVIRNTDVDTAWVTWTCHDTDGWAIEYAYHAGDSWNGPRIAATDLDPIRHARLGRGLDDNHNGCPLLAWETQGDIYYSEYLEGSWSRPQEVAHSDSLDRDPDVLSYCSMPLELGPWITWESARDGDTAIYGTAMDTPSIGRRWCDSSGAGSNYSPCGTPAAYTVDDLDMNAFAWVTDRNGNPDIYARAMFSGDEYVDDNLADDINPTLTTIGLTQNWCIWQSDRSGNWDLFGSYIYNTGVEESRKPPAMGFGPQQTVVRGTLLLERGTSPSSSTSWLLDAVGRRIMDLRPGANDVRALVPGVYFVRRAQAQAQAQATQRVLIVN